MYPELMVTSSKELKFVLLTVQLYKRFKLKTLQIWTACAGHSVTHKMS